MLSTLYDATKVTMIKVIATEYIRKSLSHPLLQAHLLKGTSGPLAFNSLKPPLVRRKISFSVRWEAYYQSVSQFSCSVVSDSLQPHESQHTRPSRPSPNPGVYSNSCPLSWWCHPAISSSVVPFSSCPQSLPASEAFPMSQLFTCGGQSIGVSASASVLPMNTQDWSPLGWTG